MDRNNYSGNTNFSFQVERFKDKETNKLYSEYDLPNIDDDDFEFERIFITLQVYGYSYYDSGKYGPYEDSYSSEGDTEIEKIIDNHGNDWLNKITKSERNSILDSIEDLAKEEYFDCQF